MEEARQSSIMTVLGELFLEVWNWLDLHSPSQEEEAFASSPRANRSTCHENKECKKKEKCLTLSQIGTKETNIIQILENFNI